MGPQSLRISPTRWSPIISILSGGPLLVAHWHMPSPSRLRDSLTESHLHFSSPRRWCEGLSASAFRLFLSFSSVFLVREPSSSFHSKLIFLRRGVGGAARKRPCFSGLIGGALVNRPLFVCAGCRGVVFRAFHRAIDRRSSCQRVMDECFGRAVCRGAKSSTSEIAIDGENLQ